MFGSRRILLPHQIVVLAQLEKSLQR
jgi:hypothetical protein